MYANLENWIERDHEEPDEKTQTSEVWCFSETKSCQEAGTIFYELKKQSKNDHVHCIDKGLFEQVTLFPMSDFMGQNGQDLIAMRTVLFKQCLAEHDLIWSEGCVGMQIIVETLGAVDLARDKANFTR